MNKLLSILLVYVLLSCSQSKDTTKEDVFSKPTQWKAVIKLPNGGLPFWLELKTIENDTIAIFSNSTETLKVQNVRKTGDTIIIPGYVFESEFRVIIKDDSLIGSYVRLNTKKPYEIPFYAVKNENYRFWKSPKPANVDFSGKWEVTFMGDTGKAIGAFIQEDNFVYGTFLTPTGDYRFLEGQVSGNEMKLSTFDGAHAFLFTAKLIDEKIEGMFYSGKNWSESWKGIKNKTFFLPSADTLTYLKNKSSKIKYTYFDRNNDSITRENESLKGKVTVIQILGTWCPNCMDESKFLVPLKTKYPNVDLVGLAFEKGTNIQNSYSRIDRYKELLEINYPIHYAGIADKSVASEVFPMLNKIISFPTTIVLDKNGNVRKIHTGFSGPGTGEVYNQFSDDFYMLIDQLSKE